MNLLRLRIKHGYQTIDDLSKAELPASFRGFPVIDETKIHNKGKACKNSCPAEAIELYPLRIDMGKCTFCGECESISDGAIKFSSEYKLGSTDREHLVVRSGESFNKYYKNAIEIRKEIRKIFSRSLKLRQVSAAGCNGCEMELAACSNVNFDMARFGIDFVASPRHADGIVITGPVSKNMAPALMDAYNSVSEPKIVIAVGSCAISGGLFADSKEINREFFNQVKIDLFVPGCPAHPLTFIHAVLDFLNRK